MNKKNLEELSDKDKRRLNIPLKPINPNLCQCKEPRPMGYITDMFESYEMCGKCNKEII